MGFLDLNLKREYRSFKDDIVKEFYLPVLSNAVLYRRAVGFFSSSALSKTIKGVSGLVKNGGRIELIASPKLSEEDIKAIELGYKEKYRIIEERLISELGCAEKYFEIERLNLLANLIANNKLDIKIAILNDKNSIGIYHEKLGIIYDNSNNKIAFAGSLNETGNALIGNYESIDVFTSWKDKDRVKDKEDAFDSIWNNKEKGLEVIDFPNVKMEILNRYKVKSIDYIFEDNSKYDIEENTKFEEKYKIPHIPDNIKLYNYQMEAITNWKNQNYRGIFDMATGTGKTFTGIGATICLFEELEGNLATIIVCPYTHLVEQWVEELRMFGIEPIVAYGESKDKCYKKAIKNNIIDFNLRVIKHFFLITTNASYRGEYIQSQLIKLRGNILLMVDEAHNFGAANLANKLHDKFKYRLALSATLDRHNDEDGTDILYDYFGAKCIEYNLERAINEDKLVKYYYYPIIVYLTDSELENYKKLSREIGKNIIVLKNGKTKLNTQGKILALKRARIIAGAIEKISSLVKCIEKYKDKSHILVYCGATNIEDEEAKLEESEIRQIDKITKVLGQNLGMKVSQFTSKENNIQRNVIKQRFLYGDELQALVAIKCLDEGVNIPRIQTAFILASTTNPKEYIQRRGRVLRKAEGKEYAEIYDFVTLPRDLEDVPNYTEQEVAVDKSLVVNEINRIIEFSRLSLNPMDSDIIIDRISECYNLNLENKEGWESKNEG